MKVESPQHSLKARIQQLFRSLRVSDQQRGEELRRNDDKDKRVDFRIGDVEVHAEWNQSETARKIRDALPIEATGNYWGGEIYFAIPVRADLEADAREVVEPGTVAYWPQGHCLCLFWGPTPASRESECRAASKVNVVGRVLNPEVLSRLKARQVRLEQAT